MKKLLILFFMGQLLCIEGKSQALRQMQSKLQGRWYSLQDSNYSVLFKGSRAIEIYENEKEKYYCRISNKNCGITIQACPDTCFYLEKYNKKAKLCYLIKSLTSNSLTLVYEGGRVLDFVKKDY